MLAPKDLRDIVDLLVFKVFQDLSVLVEKRDRQEKMVRMETQEPLVPEDLQVLMELWVQWEILDQQDLEVHKEKKENVVHQESLVHLVHLDLLENPLASTWLL